MRERGDDAALHWLDKFPRWTIDVLALRLSPREQLPLLATGAGDGSPAGRAPGGRCTPNPRGAGKLHHGEARRAIEYYEQALVIYRDFGERRGEAAVLGDLGIAYATLGDVHNAIGYFEQVLAVSREVGDRRAEAKALNNLGLAYADLGEVRHAIEYYEQDLAIVREIGDRSGEASSLMNIWECVLDWIACVKRLYITKQALAIYARLAIGTERGRAGQLGAGLLGPGK